MSNYVVNGNGPTVIIPLSIPWTDDALIRNTGPKPVFLNDNPGIYTNGFELAPNAHKIWNAGQGLYLQCNPDEVTTVDVQINTGDFYSPAPLNSPTVLWNARAVPTTDGFQPGTGGLGPDFFGVDNSFASNPADTGYINVSNYNSIIVSAIEQQNPVTSADDEVRYVYVTWYTKLGDGSFFAVSESHHAHFCLPGTALAFPGYQTIRNPQFRMAAPCRADYVRIRVFATTFTTPVPSGRITYNLMVLGDNRSIDEQWAAYDSSYYYGQEVGTYGGSDLSNTAFSGASFSFGTGNTSIHTSHRSGPNWFVARLQTSNATAVGTRAQLFAIGAHAGAIVACLTYTTGVTGIQSAQALVDLPDYPVVFTFANSQGVNATVNWTLTPERQ